ncbi:helix-turn-helix domain-containing protein [Ruegeria atlantica]|uniref:helix-turn-helix domain-containing protein n=1 Tax=Ruegeria atlantica TaxID=81569 RepID=UPI001479F110|nr:hypothetical protein [Ruegeria atlantica]
MKSEKKIFIEALQPKLRADESPATSRNKPKLLEIFEAILKKGPITLDELHSSTSYSRSATYRAIKQLETSGWIRRALNRHSYIASSVVDNALSVGAVSMVETDIVNQIISNLGVKFQKDCIFEFGIFISKKSYRLVEDRSGILVDDNEIFPLFSANALTGFCCNPSIRKITDFIQADRDYSHWNNVILLERINECRKQIENTKFYVCPFDGSVSIGLKFNGNIYGALSFSCKSSNGDITAKIKEVASQVAAEFNKYDLLATISHTIEI